MGLDGSAWVMEPDAAFGHFVPQRNFGRLNSDKIWVFPKRCRWLCGILSETSSIGTTKWLLMKSIIPVTIINGSFGKG
jgi:acetyl-CoA C-acetyltransferase